MDVHRKGARRISKIDEGGESTLFRLHGDKERSDNLEVSNEVLRGCLSASGSNNRKVISKHNVEGVGRRENSKMQEQNPQSQRYKQTSEQTR